MAFVLADSTLNENVLHVTFSDEAANDSDKSATFETLAGLADPTRGSSLFQVDAIYVFVSTTATANDRVLVAEIQDGASDAVLIAPLCPADGVSPSTTAHIVAAPGMPSAALAGATNEHQTGGLPERLLLGAGQTIRVYDIEAIDAAADDMEVHITGRFVQTAA